MIPPSAPDNEEKRLRALYEEGLLDTESEERFDRLTRLAQNIFGTRSALISLVADTRQWFKSRQGFAQSESAKDISFCAHTILEDEIFEVADARSDPRFADNPLVTGEPSIRFYAGAQLLTTQGYRIGTLCIIDDTPRQLTANERRVLRDLADCVEAEINQTEFKKQAEFLARTRKLGDAIARAQSNFISEINRAIAFNELLTDTLSLTDSEYGFIGEILYRENGDPYLKTHAITNIAWDDASHIFYQQHAPQGMEFNNLNTLFGAALVSGEPVIANAPGSDSRSGGLPSGHPALNTFLGIPIVRGGQPMAMIGIANRPGGYNQALLEFLNPLLATIGQLVEAARTVKQHHETQLLLAHTADLMDRAGRVAKVGGWEIDMRTMKLSWTAETFRIHGVGPEFTPTVESAIAFYSAEAQVLIQAAMDQAIKTGQSFDLELSMINAAGEQFICHTLGFAEMQDGKTTRLFGAFQDITEHKRATQREQQAAEALRELNQTLEDRVWRRTRDLAAARDEAERANNAKSEFLSRMSHELRTPLNAIMGFGQVMASDADYPLAPTQGDNLREINTAAEHLLQLVNEVLDLSRVESGRLDVELEPVSINDHVLASIALIRPLAAQRRISITQEPCTAHTVQADPGRLRSVLLNLLSNAVKYNHEGGSISIYYSPVAGDRLRINVRDSGRGIAAENLPRLFMPFERLESAYEGIQGTGIGLALTKKLVEAMQGDIGVSTVLGEGSTFWFELPLTDAQSVAVIADTPATSAPSEPVGSVSYTALYIEDNSANLRLVQKILAARADIRLLHAETAEAGLEIAEREQPQLILLDLNLPGMNGFEALDRLRSRADHRNIPVIAVSANAMAQNIDKGIAAGFDDYLVKPLNIGTFLQTIARFLPTAAKRPAP